MKEVKKTVVVVQYQSDDGKIWDKKEDALHRDKVLNGKVRMCVGCSGTGREDTEDYRSTRDCSVCSGRGWQELVEVWK